MNDKYIVSSVSEGAIAVSSQDLRKGDKILGAAYAGLNGNAPSDWTSWQPAIVTGTRKGTRDTAFILDCDGWDGYPDGLKQYPTSLFFLVLRPGYQSVTIGDDKWPHTCPRCNGAAYIGLTSIDCKAKCPA